MEFISAGLFVKYQRNVQLVGLVQSAARSSAYLSVSQKSSANTYCNEKNSSHKTRTYFFIPKNNKKINPNKKFVLIINKYARKKLFTYSKHGIISHLQLG